MDIYSFSLLFGECSYLRVVFLSQVHFPGRILQSDFHIITFSHKSKLNPLPPLIHTLQSFYRLSPLLLTPFSPRNSCVVYGIEVYLFFIPHLLYFATIQLHCLLLFYSLFLPPPLRSIFYI